MTDKINTSPEAPHAQAAFINAIREEGTKTEAKLAKAVDLVDDMIEWGTWYGLALSEILQRRAELKGDK